MKIISCKQLGGACNEVFHADSFEEIAEISKLHGIELFQKQDEAHLNAMGKMQKLMKAPEKMEEWFESKRKEFEALPDN